MVDDGDKRANQTTASSPPSSPCPQLADSPTAINFSSIMASLSPLPPLPSETVLQILSHLSLPDLSSAIRASSGLFSLMMAHQQGIYHRMAISHGYIDNEQERNLTLDQLSARVGSLEGVTSWRDVCESQADGIRRRMGRAHQRGRRVVMFRLPPADARPQLEYRDLSIRLEMEYAPRRLADQDRQGASDHHHHRPQR